MWMWHGLGDTVELGVHCIPCWLYTDIGTEQIDWKKIKKHPRRLVSSYSTLALDKNHRL